MLAAGPIAPAQTEAAGSRSQSGAALRQVKYAQAGEKTGGTGAAAGTASAEFSCLGQAQSIRTLTGQFDTTLKTSMQPQEAVDARDARFIVHKANLKDTGPDVEVNSQNGVWVPKGPAGGCWAGGVFESDFPPCADFWEHKRPDPGGFSWGQPGMQVQGVYIHNLEDDLRPHDGADIIFPGLSPANTKFNAADDFDVSHVWTEYIRGDCFENDAYAGGSIRDSLFDGCNAWMSMTPGIRLAQLPDSFRRTAISTRNQNDGTSKTVTLDGVLVRYSLMPNPNMNTKSLKKTINGTVYGAGPFFKVRPNSPRLVIKNSMFAFDPEAAGTDTFDFPSTITSCSNNTIVWLGADDFPGEYPRDCFTVTKDINIWKNAVKDWHERNPHVGQQYRPPVGEMGNVGVVSCK